MARLMQVTIILLSLIYVTLHVYLSMELSLYEGKKSNLKNQLQHAQFAIHELTSRNQMEGDRQAQILKTLRERSFATVRLLEQLRQQSQLHVQHITRTNDHIFLQGQTRLSLIS